MQNKFIRRYWVCIWAVSLIITLILGNIPTYALTVEQVPNPRQQYGGWVTDMVDMLSPQAENELNQIISQLEKQNGTEIAVVTVPTTKSVSTPKEFATKLFNTWGIGKKNQNNGLLFLVSKSDRRTEIKTGNGISKTLSSKKVGNIIRTEVTPLFKQGQFESGIINGTKALIKELESNSTNSTQTSPPPQRTNYTRNSQPANSIFDSSYQLAIVGMLIFFLVILGIVLLIVSIIKWLIFLIKYGRSDRTSRSISYSYSSYSSYSYDDCDECDDYDSDDDNCDRNYSYSDDSSDFGGGDCDDDSGGGDDW